MYLPVYGKHRHNSKGNQSVTRTSVEESGYLSQSVEGDRGEGANSREPPHSGSSQQHQRYRNTLTKWWKRPIFSGGRTINQPSPFLEILKENMFSEVVLLHITCFISTIITHWFFLYKDNRYRNRLGQITNNVFFYNAFTWPQ